MGIDVYTLNIALAKAWPQVEMGIYFRYPGSQPPRGGAQLLPGWGGPRVDIFPMPGADAGVCPGGLRERICSGTSQLCVRLVGCPVSGYGLRSETGVFSVPRGVTALMCANDQISHALWQTGLHHPLNLDFSLQILLFIGT